ncbi:MAG: glycosyltransferase 87 family protein [Segniliparus sp.]|uniref:glycosyltransferase 87 family protein n=1 Tax=Segniliparus sp. TaxID=2804064 RepID=UPI003F30E096
MTMPPPAGGKGIAASAVAVALLLGFLAVWAQNRLIPLDGEYWGLFENGVDLDVYRGGAKAVLESRPLYGATVMDDFWFTYPPFAAVAFMPLSGLAFESARTIWLEVSFLALVLVVYRCLRQARPQAGAEPRGRRGRLGLLVASACLAAAATALEPVRSTLWYGQVNLVLLAVVFLDLARPEGSRGKGFGVGLAAGIKLTSLIFLPYLLVTRQWRAAGWACGTFAATVVAGFAVAPSESKYYWAKGISDVSKIAPRPTPANQSIAGVLDRLFSPTATPSLADPPSYAPNWAWFALAALLGAAGLALARSARRKGDEVLALALVGLVGCAVSPFSWGHHWVWFVPLAAWLFARAARTGSALAALGFVVLAAWTFMWTSVQPDLPNAPVLPGYATGVFIQPADPPLGAAGQLKAAWYPIAYVLVLLIGAMSAALGRLSGWHCTEDIGRNGSTRSSDKSTSPNR